MKNPTLLAHDHSELDALLAAAFSALAAGPVERGFEAVDVFWARLAMHIRAEHLHLFPAVLGAVDAAAKVKEQADLETGRLEIIVELSAEVASAPLPVANPWSVLARSIMGWRTGSPSSNEGRSFHVHAASKRKTKEEFNADYSDQTDSAQPMHAPNPFDPR